MAPRHVIDPETRSVGLIATLMLFVLLVLVAVFLYIIRLARGEDVGLTSPSPTVTVGSATVAGMNAPTVTTAAPAALAGPLPTQPDRRARIVRYEDARYAFRLDVMDSWRQATAATPTPGFPAADYDVVFEDAGSGARMAVSVWETGAMADLTLWVPLALPGMQPVDGNWQPSAWVAGEPTLIVWAPETPTVPARYAAYLNHAGRRYRVAYSAADGGTQIGEFIRALVTLEFGDTDTSDVVPPLPRPTARFYPSETLFGR